MKPDLMNSSKQENLKIKIASFMIDLNNLDYNFSARVIIVSNK